MIPRALPGLVAGLAFLWIFLFWKPLAPLRETPISLWIAYTVVWMAYGLTATILIGYAVSLVLRYRAEKARAEREARRGGRES